MTANTRSDDRPVEIEDIGTNTTSNPSFTDLIASRLSRRHLFGLGVGTAGTVGGSPPAQPITSTSAAMPVPSLLADMPPR